MPSDILERLDAAILGPDPVRSRIGKAGFRWPDLKGFTAIDHGRGNAVIARSASDAPKVTFGPRAERNLVVWGGTRLGVARLVVLGRNNTVVFNASEKIQLHLTVVDAGHLLFWGAGATCNSGNIVVGGGGEGTSVLVGEDCMFSQDIELRATDSHAIVEISTRRRINAPRSIVLGPHVWLGHGSMVLGGVEIGAGSIIGASSLVSTHIPSCVVAAGLPARVLRRGVTWTREADPQQRHIDAVIDRLPVGDAGDAP